MAARDVPRDAVHQIGAGAGTGDVFADGDRVAVGVVLRGTHTGSFFGIPATGRPVAIAANVLMQASNGRVATLAGIFDEAGLLRQIGAIPG